MYIIDFFTTKAMLLASIYKKEKYSRTRKERTQMWNIRKDWGMRPGVVVDICREVIMTTWMAY